MKLLSIYLLTAYSAIALTVTGNENVSEGDIEAAVSGLSGEARIDAIHALYDIHGYLDPEVIVAGDEIAISEGPQYLLGEVRISGDSGLTQKEIYDVIDIERGAPFSVLVLEQNLAAYLESAKGEGFITAKAGYELHKEPDIGRVELVLNALLGVRYTVGEIAFAGVSEFDARRIIGKIETKKGRPLSQNILAADLLAIVDMYRAEGYADVEVKPVDFELMPNLGEIDFTIRVTEHSRVIVDDVTVSGNERSRPGIITRETRFKAGEPYDVNLIRRAKRAIYALKYFETEPAITLTDTLPRTLEISVIERPTYRVSGALGYEPGVGESDAELLGEVNAELDNLFGTGRNLHLRYYRPGKERMEAGAMYYEPWVGGVNLFIQPSGSYKEALTYRKGVGELLIGTKPLPDLTLAGGGGYERVWESGAAVKYKAILTGRYDSRDYYLNPRTGWEAELRTELGLKRYFKDGFKEQIPRVELDIIRYLPLGKSLAFALRGWGGGVFASRPTEDEYFPLGGARNLRGYRSEQFLASRAALASAEFRFLATRDSRLIAFVDGAYYWRNDTGEVIDGYGVGYGVGFRAQTRIGLYGVDYALGRDDKPLDGKIHITMTQEF